MKKIIKDILNENNDEILSCYDLDFIIGLSRLARLMAFRGEISEDEFIKIISSCRRSMEKHITQMIPLEGPSEETPILPEEIGISRKRQPRLYEWYDKD